MRGGEQVLVTPVVDVPGDIPVQAEGSDAGGHQPGEAAGHAPPREAGHPVQGERDRPEEDPDDVAIAVVVAVDVAPHRQAQHHEAVEEQRGGDVQPLVPCAAGHDQAPLLRTDHHYAIAQWHNQEGYGGSLWESRTDPSPPPRMGAPRS